MTTILLTRLKKRNDNKDKFGSAKIRNDHIRDVMQRTRTKNNFQRIIHFQQYYCE